MNTMLPVTKRARWRMGTAACCCLLLSLTACSARRSEQARADGDTYLQLGKIDEARAAFTRAESANPENAMAQLGLARCDAREGEVDAALERFHRAYGLDPTLEPAYLEATQLLLDNDRDDEARQEAEAWAEVNPEAGGLLRAHVEREAGDPEAAIAILQQIKEAYPESTAARVGLGAAYLLGGFPDKAEKELKEVLDGAGTGNMAARMALVEAYRIQGKTEEMLAGFEQLVEQDPANRGFQLALAQAYLHAGRVDEAEDIAREIQREESEPGWPDFVLGACLAERGAFEEAIPYLTAAAQALPGQAQVAQALAYARSGGTISPTPAPTTNPAAPTIAAPGLEDLDWRALWQQAALGELLRRRDEFLASPEPSLVETLVLSAYFTYNQSLAAEIAEKLPEDAPVRRFSDAMQARDVEALRQIEDTWKEDDPERKLLRDNAIAFAYARIGARTRAVQQFAEVLRARPDNAVALLNTAQVFRAAEIPKFAARVLQRLIAQYPHNINAHTLLYTTLKEGGMTKEARQAAETTYAIFSDANIAYLNLAQAYANTGEFELARNVLRIAVSTFEEKAPFQLLLAGVHLEAGEPNEALGVLDDMTPTESMRDRWTFIESMALSLAHNWPRLLEVVDSEAHDMVVSQAPLLAAAAYLHADRPADAKTTLLPDPAQPPAGGLAGRVLLGALGEAPAPSQPGAVELVEALKATPALTADFAAAAAFQAAKLGGAAYGALQPLEAVVPGNSLLTYMAATSLDASKGLPDKTDQVLTFAEAHPSQPVVWLVLADAYEEEGNTEGEDMATAKAVEVGPEHMQALFRRGRFLEQTDDLAGAVAIYRRILESHPDDGAANNNLAYLLLLTDGDKEEALRRAEKANEVLGIEASVIHTLGVCQLRTGDYESSRRSLGLALELRPGDPTLLLDYGLLLQEEGQQERAVLHIKLALQYADVLDLEFPRRGEAEAVLNALPR